MLMGLLMWGEERERKAERGARLQVPLFIKALIKTNILNFIFESLLRPLIGSS